MFDPYRFNFRKPLTNLREYLRIVKPLIQKGSVDFDGEQYHAHVATTGAFPDMPVMASALKAKVFPSLRTGSRRCHKLGLPPGLPAGLGPPCNERRR